MIKTIPKVPMVANYVIIDVELYLVDMVEIVRLFREHTFPREVGAQRW